MLKKINKFLKGEKGQGFVEYALILAVVVLIAIVALKAVGKQASTAMSSAASGLAV